MGTSCGRSVHPPPSKLNFADGRPTMQSVSQVSLPMRIALGATLAFLAVWAVALRPKPVPTAPAPTPPAGAQSAPGKAAEQAQQAAGASQDAADKHETAAGSDASAASAPAKAPTRSGEQGAKQPGPAIDLKKAVGENTSKPAAAVLRDVAGGKVAVLLFWDRRLSDDRAVHTAVKGLSRRGGKVAVHIAPIARLAKFESITRGVPVVTSPTVMIIDRAGHARSVGGLSVPSELEELVGKALKVKP
jgi:hypothetical protein